MLFWTSVIAWATVAYVVVSTFLLIISLRSIHLTKRMFQASNRPFLSIGQVASYPSGTNAVRPEHIFIQIKNVGNLPAKQVVPSCRITIAQKEPSFVVIPGGQISLFPASLESIAIRFDEPDTMAAAFQSRSPIEVFFEISYCTVYKENYRTVSHYIYDYKLTTFKVVDASWT